MSYRVVVTSRETPWLKRIIRQEQESFVSLMKSYYPRNFKVSLRNVCGFVDAESSIFNSMGSHLTSSDGMNKATSLIKYMESLLDVYEIDMAVDPNVVFVVLEGNKYIGHVYQQNDTDNSTGIIGIRKSLDQLLNPTVKGVAYILLGALHKYAREVTHTPYIAVNAPISVMPKLSENFGFTFDEEYGISLMNTSDTPLVTVPEFTLEPNPINGDDIYAPDVIRDKHVTPDPAK